MLVGHNEELALFDAQEGRDGDRHLVTMRLLTPDGLFNP